MREDASPSTPGLVSGSKHASSTLLMVLLFLISIIAYADRQVIALLKPELDKVFGWSAADYAAISSWSQLSIAVSLLLSGWIVDRLGVKTVLAAGLGGWSLATLLHAVVNTVRGFVIVRVALGVFEGVGTPATMKAVSTCFPPEARGRVIGVLNAAPNLAAMLTPVIVSLLFPIAGWRGTVVLIGASGLLCVLAWLLFARITPYASATHTPDTTTDPAPSLPLWRRATGFALGKFLTDPVWWMLLFWLPDLLHRRFGLDAASSGLPLACAYAMAGCGSITGGHGPAILARKAGLQTETARRLIMLAAACCVLPLPYVLQTGNLALAVFLCGLTLAAHQVFATNLFGFATEWVPASRTGRITGLGAFCGNVGGALMLSLMGHFAAPGVSLLPVFAYGALAYLAAWVALSALAPPRRLRRRVA